MELELPFSMVSVDSVGPASAIEMHHQLSEYHFSIDQTQFHQPKGARESCHATISLKVPGGRGIRFSVGEISSRPLMRSKRTLTLKPNIFISNKVEAVVSQSFWISPHLPKYRNLSF